MKSVIDNFVLILKSYYYMWRLPSHPNKLDIDKDMDIINDLIKFVIKQVNTKGYDVLKHHFFYHTQNSYIAEFLSLHVQNMLQGKNNAKIYHTKLSLTEDNKLKYSLSIYPNGDIFREIVFTNLYEAMNELYYYLVEKGEEKNINNNNNNNNIAPRSEQRLDLTTPEENLNSFNSLYPSTEGVPVEESFNTHVMLTHHKKENPREVIITLCKEENPREVIITLCKKAKNNEKRIVLDFKDE